MRAASAGIEKCTCVCHEQEVQVPRVYNGVNRFLSAIQMYVIEIAQLNSSLTEREIVTKVHLSQPNLFHTFSTYLGQCMLICGGRLDHMS